MKLKDFRTIFNTIIIIIIIYKYINRILPSTFLT